jgi:transposase
VGAPVAMRSSELEDCRHLTRRLEGDLLRAGETVERVPPHLMAVARRSGREPGKSDPIDALAVARAAGESPTRPRPASKVPVASPVCSSTTEMTWSKSGR